MKNYKPILTLILLYQITTSITMQAVIAQKAVMYPRSAHMSPLEKRIHEKVKDNKTAFEGLGIANLKKKKNDIEKARRDLLATFKEADPVEREEKSELEKLLIELNIEKQIQMLDKLKTAIQKLHPETREFILSLISPLTRLALGL